MPRTERAGLLREADGGTLLLDDVDALGPEEQALLLGALETGRYLPHAEATSQFHVIAIASGSLDAMPAPASPPGSGRGPSACRPCTRGAPTSKPSCATN